MNVDALAQEIRKVDGDNSLGAGALAEALMPFILDKHGSGGDVVAWITPEGNRSITAAQKLGMTNLPGGASASLAKSFSVPCYRVAPSAEVVEADPLEGVISALRDRSTKLMGGQWVITDAELANLADTVESCLISTDSKRSAQTHPHPLAEKKSGRLIGWRMADYTAETDDIEKAKNWSSNVSVLPIFEGDPNTKFATPLIIDSEAPPGAIHAAKGV